MPRIKERTSWLARPCRGPAIPDRAAEKDKKGSERAEPTKSATLSAEQLVDAVERTRSVSRDVTAFVVGVQGVVKTDHFNESRLVTESSSVSKVV